MTNLEVVLGRVAKDVEGLKHSLDTLKRTPVYGSDVEVPGVASIGVAKDTSVSLKIRVPASGGGERNSTAIYSEGEHVFERDQLDSGANGTVLGLRRRNMDNEGRAVLRLAARNAGSAAPGVGLGANIAWQLPDDTGTSDNDVGAIGYSYITAPTGGAPGGEVGLNIYGIGETTPYTWVHANVTDGWRQWLHTLSLVPPSGNATLALDSGRDATPAASAIKFLNDEVERWRIAKTAAHDWVLNRYSTSGVYQSSPITADDTTGGLTLAGNIDISTGGIINFAGTMGSSSKDPATDAPDDWVEIQIGASTFYLAAYSAS